MMPGRDASRASVAELAAAPARTSTTVPADGSRGAGTVGGTTSAGAAP
jgi:hypothetical protein